MNIKKLSRVYELWSQRRRKRRKTKRWGVQDWNAELLTLNRAYLQAMASETVDDETDEFLQRWRDMLVLLKPDDPLALDAEQLPLL